jgi:hypothetical protein
MHHSYASFGIDIGADGCGTCRLYISTTPERRAEDITAPSIAFCMMIATAVRYIDGFALGPIREPERLTVGTIKDALDLSIALLRRMFNGVELGYQSVCSTYWYDHVSAFPLMLVSCVADLQTHRSRSVVGVGSRRIDQSRVARNNHVNIMYRLMHGNRTLHPWLPYSDRRQSGKWHRRTFLKVSYTARLRRLAIGQMPTLTAIRNATQNR